MTILATLATEIRRLFYAEHWRVGTIAAQLHVHHDVVRRVLGLLEARSPDQTTGRPSQMVPYHDFIAEQLDRYPRLRATRLYDMLHERGYNGSVRSLRRYVGRVRPQPSPEVYLRLQMLPGEQAQVDWAHVGQIAVPGGERALWVFVMVLAYSRAIWGELVLDLSADSLRRSLVRAVSWFGGCTRQWLFDNPRTVVLARHGDVARFQPDLLDLSAAYCVQLRLCAVRKANQKGRVERAMRYLRDRHFAGRSITSLETGNQQLSEFLTTISLQRPHPTIPGRTVGEVLQEERLRLLPLPATAPLTDLVRPVAVDKTASIRFDTNTYSVPPDQACRTLTLAASDTTVRLLSGDLEVARHARCRGRRQLIEDPAHRAEILERKRAAQDLKGRDRLRVVCPDIDQLYGAWLDSGHNLGSLTARTVKLLDLYGDSLFTTAVADLLARGLHDLGALGQVCEQKRRAAARPVPIDAPLTSHVPDRDVIPHRLEDYDA
jgi:transposase